MLTTKKLEIKQKIMATLVVTVMLVMVFSTLNYKSLAIGSNVTMTQVVETGSLSMSTVASLTFNSNIVISTATNSLGKILVVNAIDYRGSGAGWAVAINASDFTAGVGAPNNTIASSTTYILPTTSSGTITAYNGESTGGIAKGADGSLSASRTIFNASVNNGLGAFYLGNIQLNIVYDGGVLKAGSYVATSTITIA